MDLINSRDLFSALKTEKISFFLMMPMNEMHNYLRAGLLYVANIATSHYEILTPVRYHTRELVVAVEMLL